MALKHRIRINVTDEKSKMKVLEGADRRLPMRLLRFLFGDFTTVYLLSPGQSVESVEVHEVKGGGMVHEQDIFPMPQVRTASFADCFLLRQAPLDRI